MSTKAHSRPSTPLSTEHYHGLHQIARYNASTSTRQNGRANAVGVSTNAAFSSPLQQSISSHLNSSSQGNYVFGNQQGGSYEPADRSSYDLPSTPQTPRSAASDARRTRSGRTLLRSSSPTTPRREQSGTRVSKSPKVRASKSKASSNLASKIPHIDRPLSELTADMDSVPVRDMEGWVNRPASIRQQETEKRNGYVTRPMNSFMLYRSAYAERTKQWCLQNNHQVVSAVSGESWPLESEEVRDHYNRLATIERDNHARAHPNYKFSPSKNGPVSSRKKKGGMESEAEDDDDAEGSADDIDPEESDAEWRPRSLRSSTRSSGTRRQHSLHPRDSSTYPASYATGAFAEQHQQQNHGITFDSPQFSHNSTSLMHPSSWATAAPSSSHDDPFQQQEYYDNMQLFPNNTTHQPELPYYIHGSGNTASAPSSYYLAGQGDMMYLHSHAGTPIPIAMPMGSSLPMNMQAPMHMQMGHLPSQNVHPMAMTYHHTNNNNINNRAAMGTATAAPSFRHDETQIDPMLLQMDSHGMQRDADVDAEGSVDADGDLAMWGDGGAGGHLEEWMAGREDM